MVAKSLTRQELGFQIKTGASNVTRALNGRSGRVPELWQSILDALELQIVAIPKQKTPIEEKLEQLTTLHGEEWLLDRLEALAVVEGTEELQ